LGVYLQEAFAAVDDIVPPLGDELVDRLADVDWEGREELERDRTGCGLGAVEGGPGVEEKPRCLVSWLGVGSLGFRVWGLGFRLEG
jgi:hypothetical protein